MLTFAALYSREKIAEYRKEYDAIHREYIAERRRQYHIANRETNNLKGREYRRLNSETMREKYILWNAARSDKHECDCGGRYTTRTKLKHTYTHKHREYANAILKSETVD